VSADPSSRLRAGLDDLALKDAAERVRRDLEPQADEHRGNPLVIVVAGALFAAIFAVRLAIDDPPALFANFYTVPVALLALTYGVRGGLAGAAVAIALVALWDVVTPVQVSFLGYASRAAVVLLVGPVVGWYSERQRADIARRRATERELAVRAADLERSNSRLEQAVGRLGALATIARAVGAETDLHRALARIVEQGRELAGACVLEVWVDDGDQVVPATGVGRTDGDGSLGEPTSVPLSHRGEELGMLVAYPAAGEPAPDPDLLDAIAASAATAIATARSVAAERLRDAIAVSESERSRWAWELHDQTLQGLVGLRVSLSSALRSDRPEALSAAVDEALEDIRVEISNLKHLIAELRPAALDELGLAPALAGLCDRVAGTSGVDVAREIDLNGADLPAEIETTVYRIVQEALTNVAKHAAAERVVVAVRDTNGVVTVQVRDDGRGFDPLAEHDGFGLRGMRERVEAAGGRLDVAGDTGGTSLVALLPRSLPVRTAPRA
jgi:signal transduction histidine kinase